MTCLPRYGVWVLCAGLAWSAADPLVLAQGQKPPAKRPPAASTAKPAAPRPSPAPQARSIVRTDVVNDTTVSAFTSNRRVAVVAAVGKYDDPAMAPLRFTVADAVELSAELRRQGYIVHALLNQEATNDNIKERIESLGTGGDAPGTILFAFAGHGFQSEKGVNYLATFSTTLETLEQRGLSVPEVQNLLKATGAKQSVLLIDACRNVPGARAAGAAAPFRDLDKSEGMRALLSTRPGGFSYEDQTLQHGIFTNFVIEGLRGKAANTDRKVTFDDLAGYVEKRVEGFASEHGLSQKPFRSVDGSGDFLLSVAMPLKDDEVARARDDSGSREMTNDAVSVTRQDKTGGAEPYVMVAQGDILRLYSSPSMQPYATLQLDVQAKGLPDGSKRYNGKAGRGEDVLHAVVRFEGGLPLELTGRVGTPCAANGCISKPVPLPGEGASASGITGATTAVTNAARTLFRGRRGTAKADDLAGRTDQSVRGLEGRNWAAFTLAPSLKNARR